MKSPVLLIGAGAGEATCGILYLASYLRRAGVEAYVRLTDDDVTDREIARSLSQLMKRVKPHLVGISLKWFHHVARALQIAKAVRAIDPDVEICVGGNTASYFYRELSAWPSVDSVVLGDAEVPLLALAREDAEPPNVVRRSGAGAMTYVQGVGSADVFYSHFDELFLSQLDLASFSGWVAPGKGCSENCLYCGGTRGMQKATFGRAVPFLRPVGSVQRDHREIVPRTWQLRYDFAGSTAAFLETSWQGVDLSGHSTTYFLWGVPPAGLYEVLAKHFERAYVVLDVGCFSESQRLEQIRRGLLKPCPTDAALLETLATSRRYPNLELEISGIAGLPFATEQTLDEERRLVERIVSEGCAVAFQRLQSQPGALVTEHPERFGMYTEAKTFDDFLRFFDALEPGDTSLPMVRYADAPFEAAVQQSSDALDAVIGNAAQARQHVELTGRTRLRAAAARRTLALGDWLGSHRVPARFASAPVTVLRAVDGTGLACVPTVTRRQFSDSSLQQGDDAAALLEVLAAFEKPTPLDAGLASLPASRRKVASEVAQHLAAGRFLQPQP